MSFGPVEKSYSYGGTLRLHRAMVINPLAWHVFFQDDLKLFNQDLTKNLMHQNKLSFETMFEEHKFVDMKIMPNRRWKGTKNEAVAPKDWKIDQSSDKRVYNFMKMNTENIQKIHRATRSQNQDTNDNENKDDSNKINPTGN